LAEAHAGLGLIYFLTDQQDTAVKCYRQAIDSRPDFVDPYLKIGQILLDQKRYAEASQIYRSATEIASTDVAAHYNLGLSYDYQNNMADLALNAYKRATELDPEYHQAYYQMGQIYEDKNKFGEAEKAYLTIIRHGSKVPQVYHALAQLYGRNQGQLSQAVNYAQKAIELSSESASYHNTLALIYFRLGDYLQAESVIKKALSLSPESSVYQEGWRQIQQKLDK
ncbi:TPA: tetratricopeptide repeat protein, partial [Candidatus Poribacteria bacterium]|nr:tetratricopeptide repeat protein [Candidatus Poribacteria bacterium]